MYTAYQKIKIFISPSINYHSPKNIKHTVFYSTYRREKCWALASNSALMCRRVMVYGCVILTAFARAHTAGHAKVDPLLTVPLVLQVLVKCV